MNQEEIKSAAFKISSWESVSEVDTTLLAKFRKQALIEAVRAIRESGDTSPIYRIVVVASQNGDMSIYAETSDSHKDIVSRFRKQSNWADKKTDDELLEQLGSWHYDSYGHDCLEFRSPSYSGAIMNSEYNL